MIENNIKFQPKLPVKKSNPLVVFFSFIFYCLTTVLVIFLVLKFVVYQQVTVEGKSMYPNYDDNQMLLMNQLDKSFHRGQVVATFAEREVARDANYFTRFKAKFYLKRIIGLPGEEIEMVNDKVIIYNAEYPDGAVLQESYLSNTANQSMLKNKFRFARTKVGANEYFLMGDNRPNSLDSRIVGTFADFEIFGQENVRVLPIETFHIFSLPEYVFQPIDPTTKESLASNSLRI